MEYIKSIIMDIGKKIHQSIDAKQNDIGRYIQFTLTNNGVALDLTGHTVKIFGLKSDGNLIFNNVTIIDAIKGIVKAELTNQTLAVVGLLNCELVINDSANNKISTMSFGVNVIKSINNDGAIESANEFTVLTDALNAVNEAVESVPTVEALNVSLQDNISTGDTLKSNLDANIATGTQLKTDLEADINAATTKKTDLENVIATADITTYATKGEINSVTSSLNDMSQQKLNKNEPNSVGLEMFTTESKTYMTDGKIPVVGSKSVLLPKFVTPIQDDIGKWDAFTNLILNANYRWGADTSLVAASGYNAYEFYGSEGERFKLTGTFGNNTTLRLFYINSDTIGTGSIIDSISTLTNSNQVDYEITLPVNCIGIKVTTIGVLAVKKLNYSSIATKQYVTDTINSQVTVGYQSVIEKLTSLAGINAQSFSLWGGTTGTITKNSDGTLAFTKTNTTNGGLISSHFKPDGSMYFHIRLKGTVTLNDTTQAFRLYLYGATAGYLVSYDMSASFDTDIVVDPAYYSVYKNETEFYVIIASVSTYTLNLTSFNVVQNAALDTEIYAKDLPTVIKNIDTKLNAHGTSISTLESSAKSGSTIISPNGNKYITQILNDGTIIGVPIIPRNALFIGNSLMFGFSNGGLLNGDTHGMAASISSKDYLHLTTAKILQLNPTFIKNALYGSTWERATTDTDRNNWYTGSLIPMLSDTLDLVCIQLGDNVNADTSLSTFADKSVELLQKIRAYAPKARVVWLAEWYATQEKQDDILNACSKTGCTMIDMSDLYIDANRAAIGNVVTLNDGTTTTITDSGVASHPSDLGHAKISARLLYKLGITDSDYVA